MRAISILHPQAHSLDALGAKRPRCPTAVRWRAAPGGEQQAVAQVFPDPLFEHLLFHGYQGELWLQPGAAPSFGAEAVLGGPGEVCLVLGAGNQAVVAVADVALKVLVHGAATILKMNPVNEWAGPHIEASLKPLIDAGALRVVYGGPEVGRTLTAHPAVQSVHITGSDKTYDAIVWAGQPKRADVAPPYTKPVSAELGCITPYTLVPGEWSEADLEAKAGEVVAAVAHNNSCNCLAAKVLLLGRNWAQKDAFLAVLRRRFAASARRAAFYPGSTEKYDAFAAAFPDAEQLGAACDAAPGAGLRTLPTLLLPPAPPSVGDKALIDEAWSPVLALRELDTPAGDVPAFLRAAADTLNNQVWGTLSCSVFIHPATERAHAAAFDTFLGELRYGSIGVNVPTILSYFTPAMSWGGFPGAQTAADIGSGTGQIHNTRLMDAVQKSVLRAPWSPAVTPFWSPDHGDMPKLARAIVDYMATPSVVNLVRVIVHAAKG
jgi:acyl-CoA reductase-like NAD-dependent aldehyde dehydrogenase